MTAISAIYSRLLHVLDEFPGHRIAVVGDLIADEFLYGQTLRVSREAPVLVLQYRNLVRLPGGAANAANNLLDLGCRVCMFGCVGQDPSGRALARMLTDKGADMRGVRKVRSYATPVKTRILAGAHHSSPQQIVRVDRVPEEASLPAVPEGDLHRALSDADGVIISDYGYGAVQPSLMRSLRTFVRPHTPLVVDSRFRMAEFREVTTITPNITELEAATRIAIGSNKELLHKTGQEVMRSQMLDSLLVTQGRYGMTLFQRRKAPVHIPIFGTDEVADVTGAGDTVIAVFTLSLACGASSEEAARLANYAGGLVVMKRGTATVTREELREAIRSETAQRRPQPRVYKNGGKKDAP
jgi:D-glycero-beta-D-manno-heptose-7-phosphate kinase